MSNNIWLIGTGPMAIAYAKVLKALNVDFITIGRGGPNAQKFEQEIGKPVITGGLEKFIKTENKFPSYAINAVGIESLLETSKILINLGIKNVLVEKPGVAYADEIYQLADVVTKNNANVLIAYNRRFYSSVLAAEKIIADDGGITSFNFEFTEWSHVIEKLENKTNAELENWFLGNSTHVIDLAFFLGGSPVKLSPYFSGENNLNWHPKSSVFSGAGISDKGALFSYHANWQAPGRFSLELLTNKHRLIFRPLEKLQIQLIGSVAQNFIEDIDYTLDEKYKPGLYLLTEAFLKNDNARFCSIENQREKMELYKKMANY